MPCSISKERINGIKYLLRKDIYRAYMLSFFWPRRVKRSLQAFQKIFNISPDIKVEYVEHHLAHVASAYFCSPFKKAIIISMDGEGEYVSTLLAVAKNGEIEKLKEFDAPNSLGLFYSAITAYLGFRPNSDEGKVMGLAAYGDPDKIDLSKMLEINYGSYKVNWKEIRKLPKRKFDTKQIHNDEFGRDLAAALQKRLEEAALSLLEYLYDHTGYKKLCLAGGVALNCVMNSVLLQSEFVKDIFIQPAAGDAGTSLGAALYILGKHVEFKGNYFGPEYSNESIKHELDEAKLNYEYVEDIEKRTTELIAQGKIVGWFQGKVEWGPRALGNRSILADPSDPEMKDKINYYVKHREPWRPFAPSMLEEAKDKYLENAYTSPYMILSFFVRENKVSEMISAIHVDRSARVQTVSKEYNKKYYKLIKEFKKLTGIPVVLNTSFNVAGEPIVCSPKDALGTFFKSGMDYLAIGNYLVRK